MSRVQWPVLTPKSDSIEIELLTTHHDCLVASTRREALTANIGHICKLSGLLGSSKIDTQLGTCSGS